MLPVENGGLTEILQSDRPSVFLQFGFQLLGISLIDPPAVLPVAGPVIIQVYPPELR